jgi:class 3 adenylate cyclase
MTKREEYLTHLGLHAGDVIREENNVYGGAVNIASRISGLSAPGKAGVVAGARPQASAASIACPGAGQDGEHRHRPLAACLMRTARP